MFANFRCLVFFLLGVATASAQVASGTITGTVHDSSGALIQGAKVTVLQKETAESREVVTNDHGEFSASNLHIGRYSVTVTMNGFKSQVFSEVPLAVDQVLNLPAVLQPGVITETVEVTGAVPLVDTSTSSLGQVIDNKKINDLPLNGRNVWALGLLSGNAVPVKGLNSNLPFTAGGGRYQTNDILLDGIDNNTIATAGRYRLQRDQLLSVSGCSGRIQGEDQQLQCRVWSVGRYHRQRRHEIRNEFASRRPLGICTEQRLRREQLLFECIGDTAATL